VPRLSKRVIANYLRSGCMRRLRLDLSPDSNAFIHERTADGMPPRLVRPGLTALARAGFDWEHQKVNDLVTTFGAPTIRGNPTRQADGTLRYSATALAPLLQACRAGDFLVQPEFTIDAGSALETALGISGLRASRNLTYSELRPDVIQVLASGSGSRRVLPDGTSEAVPIGDNRLPLRVIDVKLTAEPSVPYFAEVTYYAMALAGWLVDRGLDGRFYAATGAAVWPGSHDASRLVAVVDEHRQRRSAPTVAELNAALNEDLEPVELGVFAPRLRRFFQDELPRALGTRWGQLDWHVDNRCIGCEYLGYPWPGTTPDPKHCWQEAGTVDHLSRVAFVSRGARGVLEDNTIGTVAALAGMPSTAAAFDEHQALRATRTVVAGRANALQTGASAVPPQAGTSAVMPAWADLRIYVSADFDIGSGITMAFGFQAVWAVGRNTIAAGQPNYQRFNGQAFPVDQRAVAVEQREFVRLLDAIDQALQWATNVKPNATVQVYVWDSVTYDHLVRVVGRHLATLLQNRTLRRLAWLFPPDALVNNPDLSDRMSPVTVVRDAIRAVVAAPVPHYYSLLNVAREYHSAHTQAPWNQFRVPSDLFEDPLSDQIPSERAHEVWSRASRPRPWNQTLRMLERTVKVRLNALESVSQRVGDDLRGQLSRTAPRIQHLRPPTLPRRMADDARLWFVFARLNEALQNLDIQRILAMPPHEREARFKSARLAHRLIGAQEAAELNRLQLAADVGRRVYALAPGSTEVRAREGDFTFALAPAGTPGFLEDKLRRVAGNRNLPLPRGTNEWLPMQWVTQVTVRAIDRDAGTLVLDLDARWQPVVDALERHGIVDLSTDVMLDPVHRDFFLRKLEATLNAVGNPPIAIANAVPEVAQAIGRTRRPTAGAPSPVAELLWDASSMHTAAVSRTLGPVRPLLANNGMDLNPSQWTAWQESLTHRLRLIWGPPGTGKSRTLRAILLGLLHEATQQGRDLRVLVSGPTYESIDNVLLGCAELLHGTGPLQLPAVEIARLRSSTRQPSPNVPARIDVQTGSADFNNLWTRLDAGRGITVVGATPQQVHKLLVAAGGAAAPMFDFIMVDEASQMDVATSSLPLAGLAASGSVVIAGDPKQLPPIHQAPPPEGLDHVVGPIFTYLRDRFQIPTSDLQVNYRSNRDIVELAHAAGYSPLLAAHSPDLKVDLLLALPGGAAAPPGWPAHLHWTPEWARLLDPSDTTASFVYAEGRSSQWNPFEASAIAAMAWLLWSRMSDQLLDEQDGAGATLPSSTSAYDEEGFWKRGVGIVTPHRAQQALTVGQLQRTFPTHDPDLIRDAVDTVERFQGQQRDVMLATFALGDPDAIATEDEFLMSLNRFNVMASRARAKLVVLISREVVDHLSSDSDVLRGSALLKTFVDSFCGQSRPMTLGHLVGGNSLTVDGEHRWK